MTLWRARLTLAVLTLTLGSVVAFAPLSAAASARVQVAGDNVLATHETLVNRNAATAVDVMLALPRQAALTSFLSALTTPDSGAYRHFLTPHEFAADFGASAGSVSAVERYFSHYGLRVTLNAGHTMVRVAGSTSSLSSAFATRVAMARLATGERGAIATGAATLPRAIASKVASVVGLSGPIVQTSSLATTGHVQAHTSSDCTPSSGSGAYNNTQEFSIYGMASAASTDTGHGVTVALYELTNMGTTVVNGVVTPDYQIFDAACGITTSTVNTVLVDGGPSASDIAGGGQDEVDLDIEQVQSIAPAATINVYEGTQGNGSSQTTEVDVYNQIASDDTAQVVSTSWGECESQSVATSEQTIFEQMAAQGQSVFASSGDTGSADCVSSLGSGITVSQAESVAVDDPASQPFVTGVGGLTIPSGWLSQAAGSTPTVWNEGTCDPTNPSSCSGIGGGGYSTLWSSPSWQQASAQAMVGSWSSTIRSSRLVPDVSALADPNTGFWSYIPSNQSGTSGTWQPIGGTSAGSPLMAGLTAMAINACSVSSLGFLNPTLYTMPSSNYVDITSGNNDSFPTVEGTDAYNATTGYDMASGLGMPYGTAFLTSLCPVEATSVNASTSSPLTLRTNTAAPVLAVSTLNGSSVVPESSVAISFPTYPANGTLSINGAIVNPTTCMTRTSSGAGVLSLSASDSAVGALTVHVALGTCASPSSSVVTQAYNLVSAPSAAPRLSAPESLSAGLRVSVATPSSFPANGNAPLTGLQYSLNSGAWVTAPVSSTTLTVSTLKKKTRYSVRVRVSNAYGTSPISNILTILTK